MWSDLFGLSQEKTNLSRSESYIGSVAWGNHMANVVDALETKVKILTLNHDKLVEEHIALLEHLKLAVKTVPAQPAKKIITKAENGEDELCDQCGKEGRKAGPPG
jgi:hypothetical protein